jgi:hypothetical protein
MSQKPTPPRTEGSNPSLSATSQSPEIRDKRDKTAPKVPTDHDQQWQERFITPLIKMMTQRGVAELHVVLSRDTEGELPATTCPLKAKFELIPFDEELAAAVRTPH